MRTWTPDRIARAAGARLLAPARATTGPDRLTIDSREAGPGVLFVGLKGAQADGGQFAGEALERGAWGVLTSPAWAQTAARGSAQTAARGPAAGAAGPPVGVLLAAEDPLRALQRLATAWRRELRAKVIGVTGSTGKTSTKDLLLALLAPHRRTVASRANYNTEIGLPLEILAAPAETQVLVLEMAMRGLHQIAELAAIAEPDVGVIVTIGPAHLELLGTIEDIAATKAELIAALPRGGTAVIPAREPLLDPHQRSDIRMVTFGAGGDVRIVTEDERSVTIDHLGERISLKVAFTQAHLRTNLLAATAAARAIGVAPSGRVEAAFTPGRGQRTTLPSGITVIDDCYNANPMSMRAALDDLAVMGNAPTRPARRVAILGDMLELGPEERRYHEEIGAHAARSRVDVLLTVGRLAEAMADRYGGEVHAAADAAEAAGLARELVRPGDVVLVKGSRGVGLELVCQTLTGACAD